MNDHFVVHTNSIRFIIRDLLSRNIPRQSKEGIITRTSPRGKGGIAESASGKASGSGLAETATAEIPAEWRGG